MTKAAKTENAAYRYPRTGEPRKRRQPLRIDRLPAEVKAAIVAARASGETWKQTAALASAAAGVTLSATTVQRWYDLRIEQPQAASSAALQEIISLLKSILSAVRP